MEAYEIGRWEDDGGLVVEEDVRDAQGLEPTDLWLNEPDPYWYYERYANGWIG